MVNIFERSIGLLGNDSFDKIKDKKILIFGVGGVGSAAFESLLRTGFSKFVLVDFDTVSASNLNRQLLYFYNDIGKNKVEIARNYAKMINPEVDIEIHCCKAQDYNFDTHVDYVIDAIDDIDGKLFVAQKCIENNVPFIVSLGMANRFDPSKVCVTTLNKTFNDPLAKKIRYIFKQKGISLSLIKVVLSTEDPVPFEGKLNSIMTVPSAAGLNITNSIIKHFIEEE